MAKEIQALGRGDAGVRFSNGTRIEAGPFAGTVTQWTGTGKGLRSARLAAERDVSPGFEAALAEVGMVEQESIHLDAPAGAASLRAMSRQAAAADRVVLRPAPSPHDEVQVVWYQDESGGVSWHFPDGFLDRTAAEPSPGPARRSALRAGRGAVFTIPTRTAGGRGAFASGQPSARLRGPVVKLGRKIFKVLLVPLAKVIGHPIEAIVGKVERNHRQELIRRLGADDYQKLATEPFAEWGRLDGRRSLLVVHGIFSSTHGMLSGFPRAAMERLIEHYQGRAIALDQLTVSRSPEENATGFLRTVLEARPGGRFEFDVLCHSRGGIVARTLAERGRELVPDHNCAFPRVFFVAAPNAGSPLGDADHVVDMLDIFTNLITNFPDGPVLYSLEIVLAIVKLVAYAAETRLPGIAAMGRRGYIRDVLNAGPTPSPRPEYAAAAADYEPGPDDNGWLNGRVADSVIDRVFAAANDLVVPRDGVFAANGHPLFPIADPVVFPTADHVWHTDFFRRPRTLEAIFDHFGVPKPAVATTEPSEVDLAVEEGRPGWDEPDLDLAESADEAPASAAEEEPDADALAEELLRGGGGSFGGGRMRGAESGRRRGRGQEATPAATRSAGPGRSRPSGGTRGATTPTDKAVAPAPTRIDRRPEIEFHEQVRAGETNELTVRLADLARGGGGAAIAIDFAAEETSVELTVRLHAPGFDVEPEEPPTMIVHRVRDPKSEEVRFELTARDPGRAPLRREITAEFWLRNGSIGAVTHATFVLPKDAAGGPSAGESRVEAFVLPPVRRQDCDLILMIEGRDQPGEPPFRVNLRSEIPGQEVASLSCGLLSLPQKDLGSYLRSVLDPAIGRYPLPGVMSSGEYETELAAWNRDFLDRLADLGKQLWTFLPAGFRVEYFRLYRAGFAPASILVHSDEMLFPWELVIPNETTDGRFEELPPLGVNHVLGRWKPGLRMRPSPQRLRVDRFVILNPAYPPPNDLPWTAAEVAALRKLLPKIEVFQPATAAGIRGDLLKRGDVRLLHFSGHGSFDPANADLSELVLADSTGLSALAIARTRLGAEGSPIVYLNACGVGAAGVTVGRAGGFAADCLEGGFSGVIAPYWPVNDKRAARFSVSLYRKLLDGRAIGEALRELREEGSDDPTAHAFAYFGDPWARAAFDDLLN